MLLSSHILAYVTCFARKVWGLVRSTWGTSLGGDKLGARDRILNTKVACKPVTFGGWGRGAEAIYIVNYVNFCKFFEKWRKFLYFL